MLAQGQLTSSGETDIGALKDGDLHYRITDFSEMLAVLTLKKFYKLNDHADVGKKAGKQIINSMDQIHPSVFGAALGGKRRRKRGEKRKGKAREEKVEGVRGEGKKGKEKKRIDFYKTED